MRKFMSALALGVLICAMPSYAIPYPHIQAHAEFSDAPPGSRKVSMRVHVLNIGDKAASCVVKVGGQKKVTGVSVGAETIVSFDGVNNYSGYTIACTAD